MILNDTISRVSRFVRESLQPANVGPRRLLIACMVVFAVAAGVRLLHWQNNWLTIDNTMNRTAAGYKKEAQFLTDGDFRSFVRGSSTEPDTSLLTHTPGYPIFVAVTGLMTRNSTVALRLVHIALGAAAAVLVLLIAVELLPFAAAVVAGLFVAVSPQLSFYSIVLLPDSIVGIPLLLATYLLVLARKRPKAWKIFGAGVFIGISCWLRADTLLLAPFLCLFIPVWFPRGLWWRYGALLVAAFVLAIAPITIRNLVVFKSFIPLSLGTGHNLTTGIADYDPPKRFGLEPYDHTTSQQEAVMYNRPDYADDLYRPDGILRDRLRVGRAWVVIKSNKLWFMSVAARRAAKMLTYEPVAIISTEPSVSHPLDINRGELAWQGESPGLNESATAINVQPKSDYVLTVSLKSVADRMAIKIIRADTGKTLASASVPESINPETIGTDGSTNLQIPFVNTSANQVKIAVLKLDQNPTNVGPIELYRLGPAAYVWTKYPRPVVKVLQKFFTTKWMFPLALVGAILLVLARRFEALAMILAVPLYYISAHAPLHLELRYVLPIHYFWAMFVATSLYLMGEVAWKLLRR